MGKANKKELNKDGVVSPFQAKDLSLEKRVELFQKEFDSWKKDMSDKYGLTLGVEIGGYPRAILPQMVVIDLLKDKKNGEGQEKQG